MRTYKNTKPIRQVITERMIELMEYTIEKRIAIDRMDWCEKVGFSYRGFSQIYAQKQGFTDEQKIAAVNLVGANMNWIFGLEKNMFLDLKKKNPTGIEMIELGLKQIKEENKTRVSNGLKGIKS